MCNLNDYAIPAVALLGVGIAAGQWSTARWKLIFDLYEKRRAAYTALREPLGAALREGRSDTQNFFEFMRALDQAQFLFGQDVLEYVRRIKATLIRLGEATTMLKDGGQHLPEPQRTNYLASSNKCLSELSELWETIDKLMQPYMLMPQKRPWAFIEAIRAAVRLTTA